MPNLLTINSVNFGGHKDPSRSAKFLTDAIKKASKQKIVLQLNSKKQSLEKSLTRKLQQRIVGLVRNSSEVNDIIRNSQTIGELGLSPNKVADFLLNFANDVSKKTRVKIYISKGKDIRLARFNYRIVDVSYKYLTNQSYAKYISYGADGKTTQVDWLSWLFEYGGEVVIPGFVVQQSNDFTQSRSGFGYLMREDSDGNWQVPAHLRGDINDNILTRMFIRSKNSFNQMAMLFVKQTLFKV